MDWDLITEELNSKLDISSVKKRKTGRNVKDQRTGKWAEQAFLASTVSARA